MTTKTTQPIVLGAAAIEALPLVRLGDAEGVLHRVLWRSEASMAGVMTIDAGCRLGAHAHRNSHHHIWVLDGRAVILDEELGPGSYVHVPAGVDHDIDASGTDGCTVYYLYLRQAD